MTTSKAFEPAQLGPITLRNHIVMAPMTRSRALGNIPNSMMAEYYRQRAGAGLIVTEGTSPAPEGLGYARSPGLFTAEQAQAWRAVTDAVHDRGSRIFVQLMHTGRIFHPLNLPAGLNGVAPSAVQATGNIWTDEARLQPYGTPHVLQTDEVGRVRDAFAFSAGLAMDAGFDGVELHGANGYLLEQFLNPGVNQRDDAYGGSVENRARLMLETVGAVSAVVGPQRTAIRLSPWNINASMPLYPEIHDTYTYLARELDRMGIVYIHLVRQLAPKDPEGASATVRGVRGAFGGTIVLNGGFHSLEAIDAALASGEADLVSVGRPFVSNPDFVERLRSGAPFAAPNTATFYAGGPSGYAEGYTDYPTAV